MTEPVFSTDWFTSNTERWSRVLLGFVGMPFRALEIGSYEGRSARWIMEKVGTHPDSRLTCVDPWPDEEVYGRFQGNLKDWISKGQVRPRRDTSAKVLGQFLNQGSGFDFIYVDGDHTSPVVLLDAAMSFELLAPGGLLILDDYLWGEVMKPSAPKMAIDAFMQINAGKYRLIFIDYQVCLQKF